MSDLAERTHALAKLLLAEFGEIRRDMTSMNAPMASMEQHQATMAVDIARINVGLDQIRDDVCRIKRRLGLVDV